MEACVTARYALTNMDEYRKKLSDVLRSNEANARHVPIVGEPEQYRAYFDLPDDLRKEFTQVAEDLSLQADDGERIDNVAGVVVNASLRRSAYHGETEVVALARAVVLLARRMDEMFGLLKRTNEIEFDNKVYAFTKPRW